MNERELKNRLKLFRNRCFRVSTALPQTFLGGYIAKQLIRSAASTYANYRATCLAQSRKAFASKISIVLEEADETLCWLETIYEDELIEKRRLGLLLKEAEEIKNILAASRKTSQLKQKKMSAL
jgi:four helix bundle protein